LRHRLADEATGLGPVRSDWRGDDWSCLLGEAIATPAAVDETSEGQARAEGAHKRRLREGRMAVRVVDVGTGGTMRFGGTVQLPTPVHGL
jgi:hypothetical protein